MSSTISSFDARTRTKIAASLDRQRRRAESALRMTICAVAFSTAFLSTSWILTHTPRAPEEDSLKEKQEFFAMHAAEFDTLFIGSSRVNRQIDPTVFDANTAKLGMPTKSFNFGIDGMFAFEDSFCSERLLDLCKRRQLRFVFVEVSRYYPESAMRHGKALRFVDWHDLEHTRLALTEAYDDGLRDERRKTWPRRLMAAGPDCSIHLVAFLQRSTSFGNGATLLRSLLRDDETVGRDPSLSSRAGFTPFSSNLDSLRDRVLGGFDFELAKCIRKGQTVALISPAEQENLDDIIKLVRNAGAMPVLVISPTPVSIVYLPRSDDGALLLDFSNFREFPDLYRRENRRDTDHLNKAGAAIYSRLLAESWLQAQGIIREDKPGR